MRKATLFLLLLLMAVGAGATVITDAPVAGTPYKIKCTASDHTGYLGDDGSALQGRHATGTFFKLINAGTTGQYYLQSVISGKYINADDNTNVTFDEAPTTYWTLQQSGNSWGFLPNGTTGRYLNNAAGTSSIQIKVQNSPGACSLWTFDDGKIAAGSENVFDKPAFGGTVWTWNTTTSVFDAQGETSTAAPGRADDKGPVYKFVDVGTVRTAVNGNTDTSDNGGIWVVGGTSNVTSSLGRWAGSVLVEDNATATITYSTSLKGTEAEDYATVWTNGTLTIAERTLFDMNDGNAQRWYIGENGMINTRFTSVKRGTRNWDLQVVVGDVPVRADGMQRKTVTLTKKVMTWGADISSNINSMTVWYKDAEGTLTKLDNNTAITCDATGITITYPGLGYEEKTPVLPAGKFIKVASAKANFLTPATSAADNAHWYIMTQTRGGESPMYDNGTNQIYRAAAGTSINGKAIAGNEKYLVRFFETSTGVYDIQFATGNYITANLTTGKYNEGTSFKLYNINNENTHIGWNLSSGDGYGSKVDNNGAGNNLAFWGSGQITATGDNNDWSIYPVELVEGVTINYTIHSTVLDEDYIGTYVTGWADANTMHPELEGVAGYSLTDVNFSSNEGYKLTANITFPFPVSNATESNATGIESALGNSKWFVNSDGNIKANNAANTTLTYRNQDDFKWYIYPTFREGAFTFKIKHSTGKYIPAITTAQGASTTNAVVDEASAGAYQYLPCTGSGKGFSVNGTVFLTVNTSGTDQNIWGWTKGGSHTGSNLSFPNVTINATEVTNQFNTLKTTEKFDILEGSIVMGPSEFAAPAEINTAIEEAQSISTDDVYAMSDFIASTNGQKIQNYLNQKRTYGALYNHQFEVAYQYNTIILPCPSTCPDGITLYTCNGVEDNGTTLTLTTAGNFAANTPYIMESTVGNKYTIIGWDNNSRATHVGGWLTGVLTEGGAVIPAGSYVLAYQKSTGKQGFFKTVETVTCPQFKCYLTVPTTQTANALYFDNSGVSTSIEDIFNGKSDKVVIYNIAGQRINKLQKGVNIVNGQKVLVK